MYLILAAESPRTWILSDEITSYETTFMFELVLWHTVRREEEREGNDHAEERKGSPDLTSSAFPRPGTGRGKKRGRANSICPAAVPKEHLPADGWRGSEAAFRPFATKNNEYLPAPIWSQVAKEQSSQANAQSPV